MTMTVNETDTVSPFAGPISPIMFGIEHEYNIADEDSGTWCDGCGEYHYDDDDSFVRPDLPPTWRQHEEHCGWEVKTPPMRNIGDAIDVFRRLSRHFQWGHEDCGYHIHVNADPTKGPAVDVVKFGRNWLEHRDTLWRHAPSGDGYIGLNGGREYAEEMDDDVLRWIDDMERYLEVNWTALDSHTTVEVRLGRATSNMEHFEQWLRYVLAIANMSPLGDPIESYRPYVRCDIGWGNGGYNAPAIHLIRLGHDPIEVRALQTARVA